MGAGPGGRLMRRFSSTSSRVFDPTHTLSVAVSKQRREDIERSYRPELDPYDGLPGLRRAFLAADQPVSSLVGELEQLVGVAAAWIARLTDIPPAPTPSGDPDAR